jgi:hypothetical protein
VTPYLLFQWALSIAARTFAVALAGMFVWALLKGQRKEPTDEH